VKDHLVSILKAFIRLRLHPLGVISAAGMLATLATLGGFLAPFAWFFDVFTHFRVQYCLALTTASLIHLIPKHYKTTAVFGMASMANLMVITPYYLGGQDPGPIPKTVLRAMMSNIFIGNQTPWCIEQTIRKYNPDLVILEEVTDAWIEQLSPVMEPYPYVKFETRKDCFGISLYSKFPFQRAEVVHKGVHQLPWVVANLVTNEENFCVVGVRTYPPFNQKFSRIRNNQLRQIAGLVQASTAQVLLLGDLNITPWSPHFQNLLVEAGLEDSSKGWGVQPTWPAGQPLWMIPIDHCLHTKGIVITGRMVGSPVGSDHCPLIVDFALQGR
jgi:endonuclease/exonuclease/phosphatase (EEP) superfamily protein YafD